MDTHVLQNKYYDPPVSAINGHRYHPIPDTARRRHGHHRIRDRKISGYRPIGKDLTRKSARGQSKTLFPCRPKGVTVR